MTTVPPKSGSYRFSIYSVDIQACDLLRSGSSTRLQQQSVRVLLELLARAGNVVTRETIGEGLWAAGTNYDQDQAINKAIAQIRSALNDSPRSCRFVETLPRQGYRFVAAVEFIPAPEENEAGKLPPPPQAFLEVAPTSHAEPLSALLESPSAVQERSLGRWGSILVRLRWPALWVIGITVCAVLCVLGVHTYRQQTKVQQPVTILIEPLESSPEVQDKADWLRYDLSDELSHLSGFIVAAAHLFHGTRDLQEMPHDAIPTRIDYLIAGKLRSHDQSCELQVEIIRGADRMHVETLRLESLGCQTAELRQRAANAIVADLSPAHLSQSAKPAVNGAAYAAYLQGQHSLHMRDDEALNQASALFQQAISLQKDYAPAYAGLANVYLILGDRDGMPNGFEMSWRFAKRSVALDPGLAAGHAILGCLSLSKNWDRLNAEKELRLAEDLAPEDASYHVWLASLYSIELRHEEAIRQIGLARDSDPYWPAVYQGAMFVYANAGLLPDMLRSGDMLTKLTPYWPYAFEQKARAQWLAHNYAAAVESWSMAARLSGSPKGIAVAEEGRRAFAKGGALEYARYRYRGIGGMNSEQSSISLEGAEWAVYAGFEEQALGILKQMEARHSEEALQILSDPALRSLHSTPGFQSIADKVRTADLAPTQR